MYGCLILRTIRLHEHSFPQLVQIVEVPLYNDNVFSILYVYVMYIQPYMYIYRNNTGGWSEEGVFLDVENTNSTTITCVTKHLTSFSVLFRGAKKVNV